MRLNALCFPCDKMVEPLILENQQCVKQDSVALAVFGRLRDLFANPSFRELYAQWNPHDFDGKTLKQWRTNVRDILNSLIITIWFTTPFFYHQITGATVWGDPFAWQPQSAQEKKISKLHLSQRQGKVSLGFAGLFGIVSSCSAYHHFYELYIKNTRLQECKNHTTQFVLHVFFLLALLTPYLVLALRPLSCSFLPLT